MSYAIGKRNMASIMAFASFAMRRVDESELGPELTKQPIEKAKPTYPETRQQRRARERKTK